VSVYSVPVPDPRIRNLEAALAQANERADTAEQRTHALSAVGTVDRALVGHVLHCKGVRSEAVTDTVMALLVKATYDLEQRADAAERERDEAVASAAAYRECIESFVMSEGACNCFFCLAARRLLAASDAGATTLAELTRLRAIETAAREWERYYTTDAPSNEVRAMEVGYADARLALAEALATPQAGGEVGQ
jgi:hypothetical protein